jgi:hypothetical protein
MLKFRYAPLRYKESDNFSTAPLSSSKPAFDSVAGDASFISFDLQVRS